MSSVINRRRDEKCLWKSKKYRKQRTELSLQKVRNLQVIGKIANTGVYNCGKANFQKNKKLQFEIHLAKQYIMLTIFYIILYQEKAK